MPGLNWTASEQCAFYTQKTEVDQYTPRDKTDDDMCQALWCKSSKGSEYYSAGPALEGTRFDHDHQVAEIYKHVISQHIHIQMWKPKVLLRRRLCVKVIERDQCPAQAAGRGITT